MEPQRFNKFAKSYQAVRSTIKTGDILFCKGEYGQQDNSGGIRFRFQPYRR